MKYDCLVIGASGMQGRIVVRDLLESKRRVFLADLYREGSEPLLRSHPSIPFERVDLRDYSATLELIQKVDAPLVINCAEGDWNIDVYKACLAAKKHVIDLGSDIPMTKAQIAMGPHFERAGLIAITGCGSTPGINNIMLKYAAEFFETMDTVDAGFAWDSNIKEFVVPFSIESVIEELTEPAPYIERGRWREAAPLETGVVKKFRGIGSQKCFIVRHPETYTFQLYYKKDGLKNFHFYAGFPQHSLDVVLKLIELGFGEKDPIVLDQNKIRPVDAVSRILARLNPPEGYTEKEVLWVRIKGKSINGTSKEMLMECVVPTVPGWESAGCNIDTGMPASIIAQMILDGNIKTNGSFAPGPAIPAMEFFQELKKRGMKVYQDDALVC